MYHEQFLKNLQVPPFMYKINTLGCNPDWRIVMTNWDCMHVCPTNWNLPCLLMSLTRFYKLDNPAGGNCQLHILLFLVNILTDRNIYLHQKEVGYHFVSLYVAGPIHITYMSTYEKLGLLTFKPPFTIFPDSDRLWS